MQVQKNPKISESDFVTVGVNIGFNKIAEFVWGRGGRPSALCYRKKMCYWNNFLRLISWVNDKLYFLNQSNCRENRADISFIICSLRGITRLSFESLGSGDTLSGCMKLFVRFGELGCSSSSMNASRNASWTCSHYRVSKLLQRSCKIPTRRVSGLHLILGRVW